MSNKLIKRSIFGGVTFVLALIIWISITTTINQGHAGVVFSKQTGVQELTLDQGFHFVNPLHKITEYPVSTETVVTELRLSTKDGKPLKVEITYDYKNDVTKLPYIFDKFKGAKPTAIESGWLDSRLKKSANGVTSKYTILDVFQHTDKISLEIEEKFQANVGSEGFIVESVAFGTPTPDENTARAIQAVVDAQQEVEKLRVEKERAELQADKDLIEATGKSNAQIEEARGSSESVRINAEGQADANRKLSASITPEILKLEELKARQKHGWITINGTSGLIVDK